MFDKLVGNYRFISQLNLPFCALRQSSALWLFLELLADCGEMEHLGLSDFAIYFVSKSPISLLYLL